MVGPNDSLDFARYPHRGGDKIDFASSATVLRQFMESTVYLIKGIIVYVLKASKSVHFLKP